MIVYGSRISYYTGKLEAYLRYTNIAYTPLPTPYGEAKMLKEKVGAVQMPIVDDGGNSKFTRCCDIDWRDLWACPKRIG